MKGIEFVVLKKNGNVLNKKFTFDGHLKDLLFKLTDKRFKIEIEPCKLYSYDIGDIRLDIWGYIDGKAGQENTHDLPPMAKCYVKNFTKADTDLLFADSFALKYNKNELVNFSIQDYAQYYEKLLGGFEDLGNTDGEWSEDEEPTQEDKDFIVDDDDDELSTDDDWVPEAHPEPEEVSDSSDDSELEE